MIDMKIHILSVYTICFAVHIYLTAIDIRVHGENSGENPRNLPYKENALKHIIVFKHPR